MFKIFYRENKRKKVWISGEFPTRQKARNFCRNYAASARWNVLTIVHPDGTHETWPADKTP